VAALRGDSTASLEQLPGLVERYRVDLRLDVELEITGRPRTLSAPASEALLRGAQEALTNVA
jgi:signal transduction histidine kinase